MPNFNQLPQSYHTNAEDILPLNQSGRTVGVSVATLQASLQPEIILPRNMLLGRTSIGTGGPEPVSIGPGLSLVSGTLSASQTTVAGPAGPAGQGFMFHGPWAPGAAYIAYDVVTYAGQSYVATAATNGASFDLASWKVLAAQGSTGAAGPPGPPGPKGDPGSGGSGGANITIGTAAGTVAAGNDSRIVQAIQPSGTSPILTVDAAGTVNWATIRTNYNHVCGNLGGTPVTAWPGGGAYGSISALTGAVSVPSTADTNMIGSVPGIIIAAGVTGLAINNSAKAPAIAVYGGAGLNVAAGSVWGSNFTSKNYAVGTGAGSTAYNGQVVGCEIDVNLKTPGSGWGGSNTDGLWIPGTFDSQLDGQMNAVHIGIQGTAKWKNGFKTEPGSVDFAREVGAAGTGTGPSNAQFDMHVIQDSTGAARQIIQGYDSNGKLVIRPLVAIASGGVGIRIQDAAGNDRISFDGSSGGMTASTATVSGDLETGTLGVAGGATIGGTGVTASAVATGTLIVTTSSATVNGQAVATQPYVAAQITAGTATLQGQVASQAVSIAALQGQIGLFIPVRTVTSGTSVTVLPADGVVRIKKSSGSATSVVLEANPVAGTTHTIKDAKGDAALNPITVTVAGGGTIDGASTCVINTSRQTVTFQYGGDEWSVI